MRHRDRLHFLLVFLCVCLLVGCANDSFGNDTEPAIGSYTVQVWVGAEKYEPQTVQEGKTPADVLPQIPGGIFGGWQDESGNIVDPGALAVEKDTVYKAMIYPDLRAHTSYLFEDKTGCIRPDEAITGAEMNTAFASIAVDGAEKYLPRLPGGQTPVEKQTLEAVLLQMFPAASVEQGMTMVEGDIVTRGEFALVVNGLTHRSEQTGVSLADKADMPLDLPNDHKACIALLEAGLEHSHDQTDTSWETVAQSMYRTPGFINIDGWLYFVNEDGTIARDTNIGELTFGADSRFTSTDAELDTMVADILAEIIEKNPDAPRIDLLRRAFEYSRDSFVYLRRSAYAFGENGWEIEDAKKMFSTSKGNCYNFAASFWALARGLGYEAKCISGTMTKTDQPHSWVEIVMEDGKPYIFDPQMEYAYVHERDIFDKDMFMVTYAAGAWWNYKRP